MDLSGFSAISQRRLAIFSLVLQFKAKVPKAAGRAGLGRELLQRMTCQELAERIQRLQPEASARDVARVCLLLTNTIEDVSKLDDDELLTAAWRDAGLRLEAATDQHAAMTEELESLARSDPRQFTPDQIWILIRAIKVQGQILQLYVGEPVYDA